MPCNPIGGRMTQHLPVNGPISHLGPFWSYARRPLIAGALVIHFVIGILCFLQPPCALLEIPVVAAMVGLYQNLDLSQTWRMFAPPSQTHDEIQYAMQLPGGWTPLLPMDQFLAEQSSGRTLLPRGYLRVANQFRHPIFQKPQLKDEIFYFQYFQAMAAFFCFGDGRIPDLQTIRFYSVTSGIEPFFKAGADGKPFPQAKDFDRTEALYERGCQAR
jgi:hypothetical protein